LVVRNGSVVEFRFEIKNNLNGNSKKTTEQTSNINQFGQETHNKKQWKGENELVGK